MGETWLGVQRGEGGFEQRVCLKFIHESFRDTERATELFLREAVIAASLRHSNIVGVIDADAQAGYLALELVEGSDLRSILRELPDRRLPGTLVAYIAIELCKGLHYAHTRTRGDEFVGVVHRDLSPANVLISHAGEVKLTDFGVAKVIRATGDIASAVRGKLSYMSPEQLAGRPADARSDLFSLGVLLYETLSGERPFDGDNDADTVRRIMHAQCEPLRSRAPHVPREMAGVVEGLLHAEPESRFASAAAVIDALAQCAPAASVHFELAMLAQRTLPPAMRVAGGSVSAATPVAPLAAPPLDHSPSRATRFGTFMYPARAHSRTALSIGLIVMLAAIASFSMAEGSRAGKEAASTRADGRPPRHLRARALPSTAAASKALERREAISQAPSPSVSATFGAGDDVASGASNLARKSLPSVTPQAEPESRGRPAKQADSAAPNAHDSSRASLKIGVFPAGNVWINGRPRGLAPVTALLSPGAYVIAAGIDSPTQTRAVELVSGANQQLIFDLQSSEDEPKSP